MSDLQEFDLLRRLFDAPELIREIRAGALSELGLQQRLRERFDADLVRAAMSLLDARGRAENVLPAAANLWLTGTSLQQSTAWEVARHKAARFPSGEPITDLCSGIGVDSGALLDRGPVTAIDVEPAMLLRSEWNLDLWRQQNAVSTLYSWSSQAADVTQLTASDLLNFEGRLHIDPDRRVGRERATKRLEQYCPDLSWMQMAVQSGASGALKLGPASNFMQKFPGCEIELISLNGECKEATVWFGDLAGEHLFRATALPGGESLSQNPLDAWCPQVSEVDQYICDPDPAIVRSGLLDAIGEMHNLSRLDKSDEYLTGNGKPDSSFLTCYFVEACLPNNLRAVKKYLRVDPGRDYEIKCRHLKVDASSIQRGLPRGEGPVRTVFFLRVAGRARVVVARRQ